MIVLHRYPHWEAYLRDVVGVQYPPSCVAPLLVNRNDFVHPGWHSVLDNTNAIRQNFGAAIYNQYFPLYEDPSIQRNSFATLGEGCGRLGNSTGAGAGADAGDLNLWECSFLPLTNCSMPLELTQCLNRSCRDSPQQLNVDYGSTLLTSATIDGRLVVTQTTNPALRESHRTPQNGFTPPEKRPSQLWSRRIPNSAFLHRAPYDLSLASHVCESQQNVCIKPLEMAFTQLFLLRRSAYFRARVAKLLHAMRTRGQGDSGEPPRRDTGCGYFGPTESCVAAHVRRGDRVLYVKGTGAAINMTQYCRNMTSSNVCIQEESTYRVLGTLCSLLCALCSVLFSANCAVSQPK
eukprot:CAMPEP_0173291880 /NCGR_PEP_ID=MMETSP1143-20121109/12412_1 /TAXON_ID=483371 /ORGANISM="non described non described, Strain CCMP2298" /LENGTH=347 /DNA_ID=CAMNT_0014231193 /DNA_START=23 /DNA_END=1066 /DNA_ORIENTATION=-